MRIAKTIGHIDGHILIKLKKISNKTKIHHRR